MGKSATIYRFCIELSDIDRGVYETLDLRVAQHPSEELERMVVRVLARAIAHEEGLAFGRGLSNIEEAALWSHDLTGQIATWIEVVVPGSDRLHRASKRAARLLVFTHKPEVVLRKQWSTRKIHKASEIMVYRLPPELIENLAEALSRTENWFLTIQDQVLSVTSGERSLEGSIEQISLSLLCGRVV